MQNLAGVPTSEANPIIIRELEEAMIVQWIVAIEGEVRANVGGWIEVGGYTIHLRRVWVYWVATVIEMPNQPENKAPHLPGALAGGLNSASYTGPSTHYSGGGSTLGAVVRADGYAGGQSTSEILDGVRSWHIDTQEGLNAFAKWCRENLNHG